MKPPKPNVSKKITTGVFDFMDLDPLEVARQLTLIDNHMYKSIPPFEFIGQPWNKPGTLFQ
jgi:hypothetical protein